MKRKYLIYAATAIGLYILYKLFIQGQSTIEKKISTGAGMVGGSDYKPTNFTGPIGVEIPFGPAPENPVDGDVFGPRLPDGTL